MIPSRAIVDRLRQPVYGYRHQSHWGAGHGGIGINYTNAMLVPKLVGGPTAIAKSLLPQNLLPNLNHGFPYEAPW